MNIDTLIRGIGGAAINAGVAFFTVGTLDHLDTGLWAAGLVFCSSLAVAFGIHRPAA